MLHEVLDTFLKELFAFGSISSCTIRVPYFLKLVKTIRQSFESHASCIP